MEEKREDGAAKPDATREWLLQLERRVSELENAAARAEKARRRSLLYFLLAGVLYVAVIYWEMSHSLP